MRTMETCRLLRSLGIQGKQHRQNGMDKTYWRQISNALRRRCILVQVYDIQIRPCPSCNTMPFQKRMNPTTFFNPTPGKRSRLKKVSIPHVQH